MSLALVVGSGWEAFPWDEAVGIQPLTRPTETITDVIINATCHLFLFIFALCFM
jgi:hypothetical protein